MEYRIDRTTSELHLTGPMFITRLKNYVYLGSPGHYLYYDSSNAVEVNTDFRTNLEVMAHHNNVSAFFKRATLIFEDDYILVFDIDNDELGRISKSMESLKPKSKSKSIGEILLCRQTKSLPDICLSDDEMTVDMLYTKNHSPKKIQHSPCGYPIDGFYVRVTKASNSQPSNAQVYTVYGEETQDPFIKLNYYNK